MLRFNPSTAKALGDFAVALPKATYETFRPALTKSGDILLPMAQSTGTKDGDADGVEVRTDLAGKTSCK